MTRPFLPLCTALLFQPIDGSRVSLRTFQESDITPDYISWLNNPEVVRYSNQRFCQHTHESSKRYLANFIGSANQFFVIVDYDTGTTLGTLTVYRNLYHKTADIGIMVGDPVTWGQGIGFDAFRTVANALKRSGQVRKLTAGTLKENKGMVRILERTGFELEAVRRGQELLEDHPADVLYYAQFCHA